MKLYQLILDHNDESIDKTFYIVCNKRNAVLDYIKTLEIEHLDYEIVSIQLISDKVAVH